MAKLFNSSRKKLVSEKPSARRTSNYLKYAIGEIVLVVIGILIALSINTWNEERKYKNLEINILEEIQISLSESLSEVDKMILYNSSLLKSYSILDNHINSKLPYHDSLDIHFAVLRNWASPFFNYSAYETLKNRGVELISNDRLKMKIIRVFERELEFLVNDYDKVEWNYNTSVVLPYLSKNFETTKLTFPKKAKPNNYKKISKSAEFKNILRDLMQLRSEGILESQKLKLSLENLIEDISKEINYND